MEAPSKIYTKRPHINGMIMKKKLQQIKAKQIQTQSDTNDTNIKKLGHKHQKNQQTTQNPQKLPQKNRQNSNPDRNQSQSARDKINSGNTKPQHRNQAQFPQKNLKKNNNERKTHKLPESASQKNKKLLILKIPSSLSKKYKKKIILFQKSPSNSKFQQGQKSLKVFKVLNIYPKKESETLRCKKVTAMQKYDYLSQNIRLAQKLLSMKPSRPCDKREQNKFFQKQRYFKQLRSYSINCAQFLERSQIKEISQSNSLPKITKRNHTIQC